MASVVANYPFGFARCSRGVENVQRVGGIDFDTITFPLCQEYVDEIVLVIGTIPAGIIGRVIASSHIASMNHCH